MLLGPTLVSLEMDGFIPRKDLEAEANALLWPYRFARPISVARRLLEQPGHPNLLVGEGATEFARQEGFSMEDNASLMTEETRMEYQVCPPI